MEEGSEIGKSEETPNKGRVPKREVFTPFALVQFSHFSPAVGGDDRNANTVPKKGLREAKKGRPRNGEGVLFVRKGVE